MDEPASTARISCCCDAPGLPQTPAAIAICHHYGASLERQFQIVEDDSAITTLLLQLIDNPGAQGKQVHNANIVATMRRDGISQIITHNGTDFQRYAAWVEVVPLS